MSADKPQLDDDKQGQGDDAPLLKPAKPSLGSSIRSSFLAGIVVVAPIGITVAIIYWFVTGPMARLDSFVRRALPDGGSSVERIMEAFPGFGVLVAIIGIILLGAFAKNFVGRAFIRAGEELLDSTPIVRSLYRFFKNVFETALQQSERSFKEVALVEYPRPGAWAMAFVVGETKGEIRYRLDDTGQDLTSIFVPTVPNPTSGFLLFVPRQTLRPLAMTVEDAAKAIFSIGLVVPEFQNGEEAVRALQEAADAAAGEKGKNPSFRIRGWKPNQRG